MSLGAVLHHVLMEVLTPREKKMRLTGNPQNENGGIDFTLSPSQRANPPQTPGGSAAELPKSGLEQAMERHKIAQETAMPAEPGELPGPTPVSLQVAAGLWTYPQHAMKTMDGEFARSIAFALDAVKAEARKEHVRYKIGAEALLNRVHDKLQSQDAELRSMRGRLEVFETMKQLFEAGRRNDTYGMEASMEWMIREFLAHGPRDIEAARAV